MISLRLLFGAVCCIVLVFLPNISFENNTGCDVMHHAGVFELLKANTPAKLNKPYTIRRVVIDAGHGGKDNGCSGATAREKKITLAIALKVGEYIEQNIPGIKVIYTRKTDQFIGLDERANIANRNNADAFISIHCNSAPNTPKVHGVETYVMGTDKTQENLDVAMRENSVVTLEKDYKQKYEGFELNNPENDIIFSLYQNAYFEQSIKLASLVQKEAKNKAGRTSRGVKQESFLVLYKTATPSILVETGFLSNLAEEKFLKSENGQDLIASAVYRAFKTYKQQLETVSPTVRSGAQKKN